MPLYAFQCECGLQFEAQASMRDHMKPMACPSCTALAPRMIPEDVTGAFNQVVTGPVPQNTGVHDLDTHIDRVIGQSSKQGWEVAQQRVATKRQVLDHHPETSGKALSRNPDGTYRVMTPDEFGVHERAQAINGLAMSQILKKSE